MAHAALLRTGGHDGSEKITKPLSLSGSECQVPLRDWINSSLDSIDTSDELFSAFVADPRWLALTSDKYLLAALNVASSLADCISQAEANSEQRDDQDGVRSRNGPPTPGSDWADNITVHLASTPIIRNGVNKDHRFPPDQELNIDDFDPFVGDAPSENYDGEGAKSRASHYLSVVSARITPCSISDTVSNSLITKMGRIYSLGVVFYEIFSGGERPIGQPINNGKRNKDQLGQLDDDNDPLPLSSQNGAIDVSKKLNIFDGIEGVNDMLNNLDDTSVANHDSKRLSPRLIDKTNLVSIDPLKAKGLPGPLCDLIANMIDSINGDISGDEAYIQMSDVASDLQLMRDKPDKFLHDLDLEKLSMTGLHLNETIFDREAELSTLQESYCRAVSGESEIGIIAGLSGSGKSVLANRLGSYVTSNGGIFLSGKFDQLRQAKPFSAVASAFNEYCDILVKAIGPHRVQEVASNLREALGKEAYYLTKIIPNLCKILGQDANKYNQSQDCVNPQKRVLYLLRQFVEVIFSSSGASVTIFFDDLQWSDASSIEVIKQLLLVSGSISMRKQFYFIGCCRDDEMSDTHPFCNMLSRVRCFGVKVTSVKLGCMDEGMVNSMISDLLCLSPRLTRTLSNIVYHKTKGNPLFFSRLMISLSKDGLLRLSLSNRRWEWDEEQIQSRRLPDDVASFLLTTIQKLPADVQSALCTLSCFGAHLEFAVIKELEVKLGLSLIQPLEVAVKEGFLDKNDDCYRFGHDRFQEAAYQLVKPEDRCLVHYRYGKSLCSGDVNSFDDNILFTAVGQINRGGPVAVEDPQEFILIAQLNLLVGNKAVDMSDFASAFVFYDHGISFLRKNHWRDHYDLSLKLFDAAAKSAFAIGDLVSLGILSEQVLTFSKSFGDQLNILYITLNALTYASRLPESIDKGLSILSQLGEVLPASVSEDDVNSHLRQTKTILSKFTDEQLLDYKNMTDPFKIVAMKFYRRLELSTQQLKPTVQPIITLKMVNLSISHGMSPVSSIGFTYYGMLLARLGNVREGYRYVKIAQQLLARDGSKEVAGEVIAIGTQLMCFVEPLQATLEKHVEGHTAAMEAGDINNALFNTLFYALTSFWAGIKLKLVREKADRARRQVEQHNHYMWLINFVPVQRSILMLILGREDEVNEMTFVRDEDTLRERNPHAGMGLYFQKLYIKYMFRQYEQMKIAAGQYFSYDLKSWSLLYAHSAQSFISGLVSFQIFRTTNEPLWAERGRNAKLEMKQWAVSSDWNFSGRLHLLEAEEYFSFNDFENARISYRNAISSSKKHKFINDEALACELAGYFFLECGRKGDSLGHFLQSHEKYHQWGATAKANSLHAFVQQTMNPPSNLTSSSMGPVRVGCHNKDYGSNSTQKKAPA